MRKHGHLIIILSLLLVLYGCANPKVTETDAGLDAKSDVSGISSTSGSIESSSGSLTNISETPDSSSSEGKSETKSTPFVSGGNSKLVSSSPASPSNSGVSSGSSSSTSSLGETKTLLENIAEKIKRIFGEK